MVKFGLRICIVVALVSYASCTLPPNIKVCPRNSPQLAQCFASSMESLRPYLKSGNFAPGFVTEGLDPLPIGDVAVNRGFEMKLFNYQAFGVSNFKVDKIRINLSPLKIEMLLLIPKLKLTSKYTLNWKLGPLNLQGKGDGTTIIDGLKLIVKISCSVYSKNGIDYVKADDYKVSLSPGKIQSRFENLFNGQKALEDAANNLINQNINLLANEVIPQVERSLEKKMLSFTNQFLQKGTFAEFFP